MSVRLRSTLAVRFPILAVLFALSLTPSTGPAFASPSGASRSATPTGLTLAESLSSSAATSVYLPIVYEVPKLVLEDFEPPLPDLGCYRERATATIEYGRLVMRGTGGLWHAYGFVLRNAPIDLTPYQTLSFDIWDGAGSQTAAVVLCDTGGRCREVWSDWDPEASPMKTRHQRWVRMSFHLSHFGGFVDLRRIRCISWKMYASETYMYDNVWLD